MSFVAVSRRAGTSDSLDLAALGEALSERVADAVAPRRGRPRIASKRAATTRYGFIGVPRDELLAMAAALEASGPAGKPLYGVPFAIKDNIDLAGSPTTAGLSRFRLHAKASRRQSCSDWSTPARFRSARPISTSSPPA